jgi:nucleoside-diphosphate-sugar epimerase
MKMIRTRNISTGKGRRVYRLLAAQAAGIKRIVYTSSIAAIGLAEKSLATTTSRYETSSRWSARSPEPRRPACHCPKR